MTYSKPLLGTDKKKTKLSWVEYYFGHCLQTGWCEIFTNGNHSGQNIETLVETVEKWLPKEQSANSQNAYVECTVEGFNDCLQKIKSRLR